MPWARSLHRHRWYKQPAPARGQNDRTAGRALAWVLPPETTKSDQSAKPRVSPSRAWFDPKMCLKTQGTAWGQRSTDHPTVGMGAAPLPCSHSLPTPSAPSQPPVCQGAGRSPLRRAAPGEKANELGGWAENQPPLSFRSRKARQAEERTEGGAGGQRGLVAEPWEPQDGGRVPSPA